MAKRVWIFGIGKFGDSFVSGILNESDLDLALVDKDKNKLTKFANQNIPSHVCNAEVTENVGYLGLEKSDFCLVLMSTNIGASILIVQSLIENGIAFDKLFVRVINNQHRKILVSLGVQKFIDPDQVIANKIILEITKKVDVVYFDDQNYIFKVTNNKVENQKIKDFDNLKKYKVNVLLIFQKPSSASEEGRKVIYPTDDTFIQKSDQLLLLVPKNEIDNVCSLFQVS